MKLEELLALQSSVTGGAGYFDAVCLGMRTALNEATVRGCDSAIYADVQELVTSIAQMGPRQRETLLAAIAAFRVEERARIEAQLRETKGER